MDKGNVILMEYYSIIKKEIMTFVVVWVTLESTMLIEIRHVWKLKKKKNLTLRNRVKMWLPRPGWWRNGKMLVKRYKLPVTRWVNSHDLMYSMVIMVNNTVLYTQNLLKINLKHSYYTHKIQLCEVVGAFRKKHVCYVIWAHTSMWLGNSQSKIPNVVIN